MRKVLILVDDYGFGLENKINNFLESHDDDVLDVQYRLCGVYNGCTGREVHSAMIVYEEDDNVQT
jgi:hypothetical protein